MPDVIQIASNAFEAVQVLHVGHQGDTVGLDHLVGQALTLERHIDRHLVLWLSR